MVTKEIIKSKIDRVQSEYLEPLYKIIEAFEISDRISFYHKNRNENNSNWKEFIDSTYGCLFDAPIERGDQGTFEVRERIE